MTRVLNVKSSTSRRDISRFTVAALLDPDISRNKTMRFAGARKTSFNALVATLEQRLNTRFQRTYLPVAKLQSASAAAEKKGDIQSFRGIELQLAIATGKAVVEPVDNELFPNINPLDLGGLVEEGVAKLN